MSVSLTKMIPFSNQTHQSHSSVFDDDSAPPHSACLSYLINLAVPRASLSPSFCGSSPFAASVPCFFSLPFVFLSPRGEPKKNVFFSFRQRPLNISVLHFLPLSFRAFPPFFFFQGPFDVSADSLSFRSDELTDFRYAGSRLHTKAAFSSFFFFFHPTKQ